MIAIDRTNDNGFFPVPRKGHSRSNGRSHTNESIGKAAGLGTPGGLFFAISPIQAGQRGYALTDGLFGVGDKGDHYAHVARSAAIRPGFDLTVISSTWIAKCQEPWEGGATSKGRCCVETRGGLVRKKAGSDVRNRRLSHMVAHVGLLATAPVTVRTTLKSTV